MKRVSFENIKINDGFWKNKQDMIKSSTLKAVYDRFSETHRFDALLCQNAEERDWQPHYFWDSDVAKWLEGAAYILSENRDEALEAIVDSAVDEIVKNSDENGYFNSYFLTVSKGKRFTERDCHELYCAGHLIEAAVAYNAATGKSKFLDAMCRYADYIDKVFRIENSAAFATPGHPELELALIRLADATGENRYAELAKHFTDMHGTDEKDNSDRLHRDFGRLYNQDDMPLRERTTAEGHCVRALYLFCGMADIAERYNDTELADACKRVFRDMAEKKMYITGGQGATHVGEAFSAPYYLPSRTAYSETCAAIAMALFCGRMQALEVNSAYADMVERVIYNSVLSGVSMDGKAFFYENPLEIDPAFNSVNPSTKNKERFPITQRLEVFGCSCCPPNIVRFIPSIANFMYTHDEDAVYVHQYMASEAEFEEVKISQFTEYPSDGKIHIVCTAPKKYIALRIPAWCKNFELNADYEMKNGYAYVELSGECSLELTLDMPVVFIKANKRVHEVAGRVAVMRGPVVYCAEGVDNGSDLRSFAIDISEKAEVCESEFLLPSLKISAYKQKESASLYSPAAEDDYEPAVLKLIPYYAFANRGETEMLVWFLRK